MRASGYVKKSDKYKADMVKAPPVSYGLAGVENQPFGDRKGGVVWHTQGSGKSLTMVFYTGKIVLALENPTVLVITDRNDLDDQLFDTFAASKQLLRQEPVQAEDRGHLKELLKVASGGVVFTTIQKFQPDEGNIYETLSKRKNIIVIGTGNKIVHIIHTVSCTIEITGDTGILICPIHPICTLHNYPTLAHGHKSLNPDTTITPGDGGKGVTAGIIGSGRGNRKHVITGVRRVPVGISLADPHQASVRRCARYCPIITAAVSDNDEECR